MKNNIQFIQIQSMRRTTILCLLAFLLLGCSQVILPKQKDETTKMMTPSSYITATATSKMILTKVSTLALTITPTLLPSPTFTLTTPPAVSYVANCVNVKNTVLPDENTDGVLLLKRLTDAFLLDLSSMEKSILNQKDETVRNARVSPDANWLAYQVRNDKTPEKFVLKVMDRNGVIRFKIPSKKNWHDFTGWINNHTVAIEKIADPVPDQYVVVEKLVLLNPFTGETHELELKDLPHIHPIDDTVYWLGTWEPVEFDPTLNYMVYPSDRNINSVDKSGVSLWDSSSQQEIAFLANSELARPAWSPDGKSLALGKSLYPLGSDFNDHEIYSIDLRGKIEQLTHLKDYFKEVRINNLIWSPDGRYIAFELSGTPFQIPDDYFEGYQYRESRLAILDTQSNRVVDLCIPMIYRPIWSPNGEFLMIRNLNEDYQGEVYIINIKSGEAKKLNLEENTDPEGWMERPKK
jgi:WD40 repeat protein